MEKGQFGSSSTSLRCEGPFEYAQSVCAPTFILSLTCTGYVQYASKRDVFCFVADTGKGFGYSLLRDANLCLQDVPRQIGIRILLVDAVDERLQSFMRGLSSSGFLNQSECSSPLA